MTSDRFTDHSETDPGMCAERTRARQEGVSCDDNLPFLLGPEDAEIAVLLVHGFTASPWEMRLIGEYLAEDGICVLAVRLPGHGTTPEDLSRRTWQDWLAEVRHGHEQLARHPHIFGVGMSTGSLLLLARNLTQEFQGLVLCSPYLRIQHRLAAHAGWLRWLRPYHTKKGGDQTCQHYYARRPVAGIHQIGRLIRHLQPRLGDCKTPVLAFNGAGDQTIVVESGRQLVRQLGSKLSIHHRYGMDVGHILTREENPAYREMFELIREFVREMVKPGELRRPDSDRGQ